MGHVQDALLDFTIFRTGGAMTCSGFTSGFYNTSDGWGHWMGHLRDPLLDFTMYIGRMKRLDGKCSGPTSGFYHVSDE